MAAVVHRVPFVFSLLLLQMQEAAGVQKQKSRQRHVPTLGPNLQSIY